MSAENEAVVRRFYEQMNNERKNDLAPELFTADHVMHDPQAPTGVGPQGMADLVSVYGKRAVYADSVYGVGPTTASKILAKMQDTEKEFLNDLFEAKLKYVTTRPYWNEPQAKPKLYS